MGNPNDLFLTGKQRWVLYQAKRRGGKFYDAKGEKGAICRHLSKRKLMERMPDTNPPIYAVTLKGYAALYEYEQTHREETK